MEGVPDSTGEVKDLETGSEVGKNLEAFKKRFEIITTEFLDLHKLDPSFSGEGLEQAARERCIAFYYKMNNLFTAWESRQLSNADAENKELISFFKDFEERTGLSILNGEQAFYVGKWMYINEYAPEEILDIGFSQNNLYFWHGLITERGERLKLQEMDDSDILALGKKIIDNYTQEEYRKHKPYKSLEGFQWVIDRHVSHGIWDEFGKFLKLEGKIDELLELAKQYPSINVCKIILKKIAQKNLSKEEKARVRDIMCSYLDSCSESDVRMVNELLPD